MRPAVNLMHVLCLCDMYSEPPKTSTRLINLKLTLHVTKHANVWLSAEIKLEKDGELFGIMMPQIIKKCSRMEPIT